VIVYLSWFGLDFLFILSVTHVTLDTSITDYNLYGKVVQNNQLDATIIY